MPNYQNSKIYKIICDETNLTYYGSTTKKYLCQRMSAHKHDAKKGKSTGISGMTNPKIYLVEKFPCDCKEELFKRERFYIENNECCNKQIPSRTKKEYKEINKEKHNEYCRNYTERNREKLNEISKERYKLTYSEKRKENYQKNKEEINAKRRERYALRKERSKYYPTQQMLNTIYLHH